jgi:hypothetical protein
MSRHGCRNGGCRQGRVPENWGPRWGPEDQRDAERGQRSRSGAQTRQKTEAHGKHDEVETCSLQTTALTGPHQCHPYGGGSSGAAPQL